MKILTSTRPVSIIIYIPSLTSAICHMLHTGMPEHIFHLSEDILIRIMLDEEQKQSFLLMEDIDCSPFTIRLHQRENELVLTCEEEIILTKHPLIPYFLDRDAAKVTPSG